MQSVLSQSAVTAVRSAGVPTCSRRSVVVRASAEEVPRRAMLASLAAGLGLAAAVLPANAIDVFDDRKARQNGFDIIYEARDLDLPQSVRDGLTQARTSLEDTKKRVAESAKRVDISDLVQKKYWTKAREELRGQVGTLRFDLNTLASKLDKTSKKSATKLKDTFLAKVDDLDFAIRKKDENKAAEALAATKTALSDILAAVA